MMSFLPGLLYLSQVSPTIIRVALAGALGYASYGHFPRRTYVGVVLGALEAATALALLLGAATQVAAIIALLTIATQLSLRSLRINPISTLLLMGVLALSLILTGSGKFGVDLGPL